MNADVKPGYKLTDIGIIPSDWEVRSLKEVVDFKNGRPHEGNLDERGRFALITLDSIGIDGKLKADHKKTNTQDGSLRKGDIVSVLSDLAHGNLLGLSDLIPTDDEYVLNQRMARLRLKTEADPNYIRLQINRKQSHFKSRAQGTSQRHIYRRDFDCLAMPFPDFHEQTVISGAISDMDALISGLDQIIAKKRDIKQAAMQQLLTGQARLPGFNVEWEVKRLGDFLSVRHGKNQHSIESRDGRYPILATGGEIGRTDSFLYDKPSVLIGRKGTIDKPVYREEPFWTVDTLFYTDISGKGNPKFIYYKFLMIDWRAYNEASGVPSLNASTIEAIEVNAPCLSEQAAIAAILSDMDADLVALDGRLEKARRIKQGMMQELLTGRIRLV